MWGSYRGRNVGKALGQESTRKTHRTQEQQCESVSLNERLLKAVLAISGCATIEEALEPLLDAALRVMKMDGGGVYWVEGDVAVLRYHRGLPEAFIREVTRMPLSRAPIQVLLHQREPIEVAQTSPAMRELCRRHGIRHAFSFPLRAKETVFGYLNVGSTRAEEPARADLLALQVLVSQMEALFCRLYDEKALRESEERYRSLWESALDGIVVHELLSSPRRGRFIDVNDCACRMLDYTREEILTLSPLDLVAEEEKERMPELAARARRSGRMLFETTLVAKNGRRIPVEINSNVIQLGGRRAALAIIRDVTERKRVAAALRESEERYRMLAETARDFIFVVDTEERVRYVNQYGAAALGGRPEEMIGRRSSELFPPDTAARHSQSLRRVIESRESLCVVAFSRFQDHDLWLMTQLTPIHGPTGEVQGVLGIARDITQQKHLEEELRRLNEQLELQVAQRTAELTERASQLQKLMVELAQAEDRERKRLAEFLHDDLQQMLAAVKFQVSILGGRVQGDEAVRENIRYAKQILKDAIEKSRNLSRELCPQVLYEGSLEDLCNYLASQMESKHGLAVQVEIRGGVNSDSASARSFLYRAAQEFLFNVVKHAHVQEAKLRLQRVRNELWLTISDKGRGFDVETLDKTAGYGLLSIQERAELLGGRMRIKSIPGRGSIFFVTIPDADR